MSVTMLSAMGTSPCGEPAKRRGWRWVALGSAFIAAFFSYLSMMHMAAIVDGPGIGFGNWMDVIAPGWLIGAVVFVLAAIEVRSFRWTALCVGSGIVIYVGLMASGVGHRILANCWERHCDRQEGDACRALAGVYSGAIPSWRDPERASVLQLRACRYGDTLGCLDVLRGKDRRHDAQACTQLESLCRGKQRPEPFACDAMGEHCGPGTRAPAPPSSRRLRRGGPG